MQGRQHWEARPAGRRRPGTGLVADPQPKPVFLKHRKLRTDLAWDELRCLEPRTQQVLHHRRALTGWREAENMGRRLWRSIRISVKDGQCGKLSPAFWMTVSCIILFLDKSAPFFLAHDSAIDGEYRPLGWILCFALSLFPNDGPHFVFFDIFAESPASQLTLVLHLPLKKSVTLDVGLDKRRVPYVATKPNLSFIWVIRSGSFRSSIR